MLKITVLHNQYHVARGNIYSCRNHLALQSNAPLISPLHLPSSKIKWYIYIARQV